MVAAGRLASQNIGLLRQRNENVTLGDELSLLNMKALNDTVGLRHHRDLHFHGLENHKLLALRNGLSG